jgi:aldehyde:ferredoxin oxidoreductase
MPNGYNGKILRINLTTREIKVEEPGRIFYRRYLGGRGFIAYYLLKEVSPDVDALSVENKLIFATSVMTGAPVPGFGRQSVGAKSPLTGFFGETESGGFWGPELKFAGYDAIVVEGKAEFPVYLWIKDGEVGIRDAKAVWGKETGDAYDMLLDEVKDPKAKTLIIGPAGENLVRVAGIAHDLSHYHGRTGMGAVMGSKNLKAIVVRGTKKLEFANPQKLNEIAKYFAGNYQFNADNKNQHNHGTSDYYFGAQHAGSLPSMNFTEGQFDGLDYTADDLHEAYKIKSDGCYACPVRCKQVFKAEGEITVDPKYGGPEFETLAAFGSLCGIKEMISGPKAHERCNALGLDTVSTGVIIAFAMECYQEGLITQKDTGGLELDFGNFQAMLALIEQIAHRQGLGDLLAEGTKIAAQKIGRGAEKFAMQVKGQEFAMAEPRAKFGVGLAYAVSPTGADHLQHEHDGAFDPNLTGYSHTADDPNVFLKSLYPMGLLEPVPSLSLGGEKVQIFTYLQHYWSLFECLDLCVFIAEPVRTMKVNQIVEALDAVTGWESSLFELMKVGERALTMARSFNVKHGMTRADDTLPDRLFEELKHGPLEGSKMDRAEFEKSITMYYQMMGWDEKSGVPTEGKLYELGIGWVFQELPRG